MKKVPNTDEYSESWLIDTLNQNFCESKIEATVKTVNRIPPYFKNGLTKSFNLVIEFECNLHELKRTDIWIQGTQVEKFRRKRIW